MIRLFALVILLLTAGCRFGGDNTSYAERDFASLLIPQSEFLGYIGDDYQKLDVVFTSVERDKQNPSNYLVKGHSTTKGNKQNFEGNIVLKEIRILDKMNYGLDDELKDSGMKAQGVFVGSYTFTENPKEKNSGVFSGTMTFNWLIDKNDTLLYNDIGRDYSDGFCNHQYIGQWASHHSKIVKTANWGEYRIPLPLLSDLDIGAAEFSPNPKYHKQGWWLENELGERIE